MKRGILYFDHMVCVCVCENWDPQNGLRVPFTFMLLSLFTIPQTGSLKNRKLHTQYGRVFSFGVPMFWMGLKENQKGDRLLLFLRGGGSPQKHTHATHTLRGLSNNSGDSVAGINAGAWDTERVFTEAKSQPETSGGVRRGFGFRCVPGQLVGREPFRRWYPNLPKEGSPSELPGFCSISLVQRNQKMKSLKG